MSNRVAFLFLGCILATGELVDAQQLYSPVAYYGVDAQGRLVLRAAPVAASTYSPVMTGVSASALMVDSRGRLVNVVAPMFAPAADASATLTDDVDAFIKLLTAVRKLRCPAAQDPAPKQDPVDPVDPQDPQNPQGATAVMPLKDVLGAKPTTVDAAAATEQATQTVRSLESQLFQARWNAYHMQQTRELLRQSEELRNRAKQEAAAAGISIE